MKWRGGLNSELPLTPTPLLQGERAILEYVDAVVETPYMGVSKKNLSSPERASFYLAMGFNPS